MNILRHVLSPSIGMCVILLIHQMLYNMTYGVVNEYSYPSGTNCLRNVKNKTEIAIFIPTTTRNKDQPDLASLSLMKIALPSISVTMEIKYHYTVYVAIDEDDYLVNAQDMIAQRFCFVKVIGVKGGTFTDAINEIAEVAYDDNMTYFVRINDDTRFMTQNWTSVGIKTLLEFKPQNVGVVGPTCEEGNTKILTHDMVHRTHLDIFGYYYSPVFENFWADDWITNIYKPNRSKKCLD